MSAGMQHNSTETFNFVSFITLPQGVLITCLHPTSASLGGGGGEEGSRNKHNRTRCVTLSCRLRRVCVRSLCVTMMSCVVCGSWRHD